MGVPTEASNVVLSSCENVGSDSEARAQLDAHRWFTDVGTYTDELGRCLSFIGECLDKFNDFLEGCEEGTVETASASGVLAFAFNKQMDAKEFLNRLKGELDLP